VEEDLSNLSAGGDFSIDSGRPSLGPREIVVYQRIGEHDALLAEAYMRAVVMTRGLGSPDLLAPILALHLCRELMNALPRVIDTAGVYARIEYHTDLQEVVEAWPVDADGGRAVVPDDARKILLDLLSRHEASYARVGGFARMVKELDPSTWKLPTTMAAKQWDEVHDAATATAHHLMNAPVAPPSLLKARRTIDDLTTVLFSTLARHFDATDALDQLLALPSPTVEAAADVAKLLTLQPQAAHFFHQAEPVWLPALVAHGHFFDSGPDYVAADQPGYIRHPPWPQGEFLLRAAATDHEAVLALLAPRRQASKPRHSGNPYVVRRVVEILVAVPVDAAARHLAKPADWPFPNQVTTVTVEGLTQLSVSLIAGGHEDLGYRIAKRIVRALAANSAGRGSMSDHLMGVFLGKLEAHAQTSDDAVRERLARFLVDELRRMPRPKYDSSDAWLTSFEEDPDYHWEDRPWRLLRAAYRVALTLPDEPLRKLVVDLAKARQEMLRRLALALATQKVEANIDFVSAVIAAPDTWDSGSTHDDYRRLIAAAFGQLRPSSRSALIAYAVAAKLARNAHRRAARHGTSSEPAREWVATWRSGLLWPVADQLTRHERLRLGELAEPPARIRTGRVEQAKPPLDGAQMLAMPADELGVFLRSWTPTGSFFDADKPSLAAELRASVAGSPSPWAERLADMGDIPLVYVTPAIRAFEEAEQRAGSAVPWAPIFEWARRALDRAPVDKEWGNEAQRAVASVVERAARNRRLSANEQQAAVRVLVLLLAASDPTPDRDATAAAGAMDLISLSMNSVRGEAVAAGAWLLHHVVLGPHADAELGKELAGAMTALASTDRSLSIATSFGRGLPLLMETDEVAGTAWAELLLAESRGDLRTATWHGYLLTWIRPISIVVREASDLYRETVEYLPTLAGEPREPLSVVEQLGRHTSEMYLRASITDAPNLLRRFFELARDSDSASVSRHITDYLALEGLPDDMAERAIEMLAERPTVAGSEEGDALIWAARTRYRRLEVLSRVVLPAIEAGHGGQDFADVLQLMAEHARADAAGIGTALDRLMGKDQWHSMPVVAKDELTLLLRELLATGDAVAVDRATKVINDLGARGYADYRDLLT
jgi:hypothetical protein